MFWLQLGKLVYWLELQVFFCSTGLLAGTTVDFCSTAGLLAGTAVGFCSLFLDPKDFKKSRSFFYCESI